MSFDVFDNYECEGQISIFDLYKVEIPERIFAVSKIFAKARKQMNLPELKAFTYALTNFRYTEECKNTMMLDKKTVAKIVGINSDSDHLSQDLKRSIGQLPAHSYVEFESKDHDFYENGFIINKIRMYENKVWLKFDEDYIKLFTHLEKDYIRMWSGDIFSMKSERSIAFYEDLRLHTDTREGVCYKGYGIKALKEMFGMKKEDYCDKNGHFQRTRFEERVIEPLVEDMKNCRMINLVLQPDGKYYEKVKERGRVMGYRFYWTYSDSPKVATASEVKPIQERVDKNPLLLKVAKDVLEGDKKARKGKKKNHFNDFSQRGENMTEKQRKRYNDLFEMQLLGVREFTPEEQQEYKELKKLYNS